MSRITSAIKSLLRDLWYIRTTPSQESKPVVISGNYRFAMQCRFALVLFVALLASLVVARYFWKLQIKEHDIHLKQANTILGFRQKLIGTRGEIYDLDDNLLVTNIRTKDLYLTPKIVIGNEKAHFNDNHRKLYELIEFMAQQLDLNESDIQRKCDAILENGATIQAAQGIEGRLAARINAMNLEGVKVHPCEKDNTPDRWDVDFTPLSVEKDDVRDAVIISLEDTLSLKRGTLFKAARHAMNLQTPLLVRKNMPLKEADSFKKAFAEWVKEYNRTKRAFWRRIPTAAIHFDDTAERFYPKGHLMPNLLGYCDVDGNGLGGIERLMNEELKEKRKMRDIVLDGNIKRRNIPSAIYSEALNGYEVHLTIQLPIQRIVENNLARLVEKHKPKAAYIVMMEPKTGAVMALAQYPNFDSLDPSTISKNNREFHALVSGYEPGSIMKGISVSSVMDCTKVTPDTIFYCEQGRWLFAGKYLKEHGHAKFGDLSVKDIIKVSSNVGSAKAVIENLPPTTFYNYLRAYGFGMPTYLGFFPQEMNHRHYFKGESRGTLRPVANWYKIDISRIAIGHSILVTPLQMAQAYCAIANKGVMMQPYIIDRIVSPSGQVIHSVPYRKGNPISAKTADAITECLKTTTQKGGTATRAKIKGYSLAAKTGTAMKPIRNENGKATYVGSKLNTASLIGFAPTENPSFVLLITADEPSGKDQYGGSVCGEYFSEIASETLRLLQVPPDEPEPSNSTAKF